MSLAAAEEDVETVNHLARQALRSSAVPAAASPAAAILLALLLPSFFCSSDMLVALCNVHLTLAMNMRHISDMSTLATNNKHPLSQSSPITCLIYVSIRKACASQP